MSPETLALAVLGWILSDPPRAERFLDLTGLTPDILREQIGEQSILAAVLEFLINHEPDLVAAADGLQISPQAILVAHNQLSA